MYENTCIHVMKIMLLYQVKTLKVICTRNPLYTWIKSLKYNLIIENTLSWFFTVYKEKKLGVKIILTYLARMCEHCLHSDRKYNNRFVFNFLWYQKNALLAWSWMLLHFTNNTHKSITFFEKVLKDVQIFNFMSYIFTWINAMNWKIW